MELGLKFDLKKAAFIPIVVLAISLAMMFNNWLTTGEFITKDVDLKGGTLISIETSTPVDTHAVENKLIEKYGAAIVSGLRTTSGYGANIEVDKEVNSTAVLNDLKEMGIVVDDFTAESIEPALGRLFFDQMRTILIVAFVFMSFVIFLIYRNFVTSFGMIFATGANMISAIAIANFLGMSMSFASFAGLLMLVGYTIDTNIVLTSKVLGHGTDDFNSRYKRALRTGLTMSATITVAMLLVPLFTNSKLLVNIANILVIGFLIDLLYTWLFNAGLLKIWHERRLKLKQQF
jgi:preprotein translocase subunit SecF